MNDPISTEFMRVHGRAPTQDEMHDIAEIGRDVRKSHKPSRDSEGWRKEAWRQMAEAIQNINV